MPDNPLEIMKALTQSTGGMLRFGKGFMGRSAGLLYVLLLILGVAIARVPGTIAILSIAVLAIVAFFLWLIVMRDHTQKHPDSALLEGAEWTAWKKYESRTKMIANPPALPAISEPGAPPLLPESEVEESDK